MRRALKLLLVAALVLAVGAVASGFVMTAGLSGLPRVGVDAPDGGVVAHGAALAHAVAGHAAAGAAALVAAIAFVLGLQGLLEAGGRRVPAALLFLLAPVLMAVAIAADVSGTSALQAAGRERIQGTAMERLLAGHAMGPAGLLVALLVAFVALTAWLLRARQVEEE